MRANVRTTLLAWRRREADRVLSMQVVKTTSELRSAVAAARKLGKRVGFVPTMGYLHAGHLSLVRQAREHADVVVVSIFVNPTQFNDKKDFEAYPIDIERDAALLTEQSADLLFLPTPETVYGPGIGTSAGSTVAFQSWVNVSPLIAPWEGAHRPGHFRGVSTVVSILFNLVQPDCAVFGEKDFQQLRLIEQMVQDLKFNLTVVRGALVRELDGLAMSSRNVRLTPEARAAALCLSRGLFLARELFANGNRTSASLVEAVHEQLRKAPLVQPEYVALVSERTLEPLSQVSEPARLLVAAFVGGVRLIDNIALG